MNNVHFENTNNNNKTLNSNFGEEEGGIHQEIDTKYTKQIKTIEELKSVIKNFIQTNFNVPCRVNPKGATLDTLTRCNITFDNKVNINTDFIIDNLINYLPIKFKNLIQNSMIRDNNNFIYFNNFIIFFEKYN